jgi:hypothetical protein
MGQRLVPFPEQLFGELKPLTLKFSCQANFTRAFREATGQTPTQYRRSIGMIAA